jgi:hypothetical protein
MSRRDWLSCWTLCCWRWWNICCTMCFCKHESSCRVWFKGWWLGDDEILKGFQEQSISIFKLCMCCFTMFVCVLWFCASCESTLMKGSSKSFWCLLDHGNCGCRSMKMLQFFLSTHETFMWALKVLLRLCQSYDVNKVKIIGYVWLVDYWKMYYMGSLGIVCLFFVGMGLGYGIHQQNLVVCYNWKMFRKTSGVHWVWDWKDLTPRNP